MKTSHLLLGLAIVSSIAISGCSHAPRYTDRAQRLLAELNNPKSDYVMVMAHRADWRNWPENSLEAIESAIDMGCDILELDVALTRDSQLVLIHDNTLDRMTTGHGPVSDYTLAELKELRLRQPHGVVTENLRMATLKEALELCKGRALIQIDHGWDLYDEVLRDAEEVDAKEIIIMKGRTFVDRKELMYAPQLSVPKEQGYTLFGRYKEAGIVPPCYEIVFHVLTPEVEQFAKDIVESGSRVWVGSMWKDADGGLDDDRAALSGNPDEIYGKLVDMGCSIIMTDRPAQVIESLHRLGRHAALGVVE
ncbi:MAG: glycerophosphodiester phosphodiesterase family protein [Bacteroidales bacterium]|nr:glycerophosphodiester phosphodiesterase family protein [Bacteroidales bacterium]